MRKQVWILLIVGVFALGLVAAGCGGSDDTGTEVTVEDTAATTEDTAATTSEDTDATTTSEDTTTSGDSGVDTDAFLQECQDTVAGTVAESAGNDACQTAADALESCASQANSETAIGVCQQIADQAVKSLQATTGG